MSVVLLVALDLPQLSHTETTRWQLGPSLRGQVSGMPVRGSFPGASQRRAYPLRSCARTPVLQDGPIGSVPRRGSAALTARRPCRPIPTVRGVIPAVRRITGKGRRTEPTSGRAGPVRPNGKEGATLSPALPARQPLAAFVSLGRAIGRRVTPPASPKGPNSVTPRQLEAMQTRPTWAITVQSSNRWSSDQLGLLWLSRWRWFSIQTKK